MKFLNLILLGLGSVLLACNSNSSKPISLSPNDSLKTDTIAAEFLIVPGKSIGKIYLGQDIAEVAKILGKADAGDAAMGKAWGIWYGKDTTSNHSNEIAVYSAYADSNMLAKDVKQIRITSNQFETSDGLNTGNILSNFKVKYPDFEKLSTYFDTNYGDTIVVYDSKLNGIGAEFIRDISRAITIHKAGTSINESYLTLHPTWKFVK